MALLCPGFQLHGTHQVPVHVHAPDIDIDGDAWFSGWNSRKQELHDVRRHMITDSVMYIGKRAVKVYRDDVATLMGETIQDLDFVIRRAAKSVVDLDLGSMLDRVVVGRRR